MSFRSWRWGWPINELKGLWGLRYKWGWDGHDELKGWLHRKEQSGPFHTLPVTRHNLLPLAFLYAVAAPWLPAVPSHSCCTRSLHQSPNLTLTPPGNPPCSQKELIRSSPLPYASLPWADACLQHPSSHVIHIGLTEGGAVTPSPSSLSPHHPACNTLVPLIREHLWSPLSFLLLRHTPNHSLLDVYWMNWAMRKKKTSFQKQGLPQEDRGWGQPKVSSLWTWSPNCSPCSSTTSPFLMEDRNNSWGCYTRLGVDQPTLSVSLCPWVRHAAGRAYFTVAAS